MQGRWRLIADAPGPAARMMAVDEALLWSVSQGGLPVLRLYGWYPAAFSLGRHQNPDEVLDLTRCKRDGVMVVRRVTGGGAIYHADEITYCFAVPLEALPRQVQGVKDSFRFLTEGLLHFYRSLGLNPQYAGELSDGRVLGARTPLCFAGSEWFDIVIDGKKIGGNAQRRTKTVILQHGSIPLTPALARSAPYLHGGASAIPSGTTSLSQLGVSRERGALISALVDGFTHGVGVPFVPDQLSAFEQRYAADREERQFGADIWTREGRME